MNHDIQNKNNLIGGDYMKNSRSIYLMASAFALCPAGISHAQTATPAPAATEKVSETADIIVTARKRSEKLQDVPVSITAFTAKQLQQNGFQNVNDLAISNPNVSITSVAAGGDINSTFAIRGNVQGATTLVVDPSVGTYLDGHIISHNFGSIGETVDVKSVETLKGPQGTLFGRNTTGGAVLIETNDPKLGVTSGYVQADIGNLETRNFGGAINMPVGDIIAVRLVYQNNAQGYYETFSDGRTLGNETGQLLRAKVLIQPTVDTQILLAAEKGIQKSNTALQEGTEPNAPVYSNVPVVVYPVGSGLSPGEAPSDPRTNGEPTTFTGETYSAKITQNVGNGNIKLIAEHRDYSDESVVSLPPLFGYSSQDRPNNHDTAIDLQYNSSFFNKRLDVAAGIFYYQETVRDVENTPLYSGLDFQSSNLVATARSESAYFQATGHITDKINLTGGLRYTSDKKDGLLYSAQLETDGSGTVATAMALPPATLELKHKRANYLVTLDYKPVRDVLVYASTASGYRAGGFGVNRQDDNGNVADPLYHVIASFQPESVTNYEVGFKSQLFDRHLTVNGAGFYQKYTDYQYGAISPVTVTRVTLNTNAVIKGFELDSRVHLDSGTSFGAYIGYTDAQVSGSSSPSDGANLSYIPRTTWGANVGQALKVASGELNLNANYSWRSSYSSNVYDPLNPTAEGSAEIKGLGLLNLTAVYSIGRYSITAYARNMTNQHYYSYITTAGPALNFAGLGLPRQFGVRLRYDF